MSDDFRKWTAKSKALQSIASPDHRAFMDQAKRQLLIVLVNRLWRQRRLASARSGRDGSPQSRVLCG